MAKNSTTFLNFSKIKNNQYKIFFLLPAIIVLLIFFITPNILNFFYAFTDWNSYKSEINFVGFENFKYLIQEGALWKDLIITLQYAFLVAIFQNIIALTFALLLEKTKFINKVYRIFFVIPVLISSLATGYLFKALLDPKGAVNSFLSLISGKDIHIAFLGSLDFTIFILVFVHCWKYFGLSMLVYIAGLSYIPIDLIEAARIEGAGPFRIIKNIKLPLLGAAFTFSLTTTLVGTMGSFELPIALTGGGPARTTEVLNIFIFNLYGFGRLSYATCINLVFFIIICAIAIPMINYLRRREIEL